MTFQRFRKIASILNKTQVKPSKIQLSVSKQIIRKASQSSNILMLHERGIFQNVYPEARSPELSKLVRQPGQRIYCGYDPTADSLHVGNLVTLMAMLNCQRAGHQPLVVIGEATAQIGDPSGRTKERQQIDAAEVKSNTQALYQTIKRIFTHHKELLHRNPSELLPPIILNNMEWYSNLNVIEYLGKVGRYFRMGTMLSKQSVKSRLGSPEGMSFSEFTYQTFQAFDWLHLCKNYQCQIQVGGNDQIGNIMSGQDLIGKILRKEVFGLTVPLITDNAGEKLGKSAGNAVWLDPGKTSPFEFYQHFIRTPDSLLETYLKIYTFLPENEIQHLVKHHERKPESKDTPRKLAEQVTLLVHGEAGLESAKRCTNALYHNAVEALAEMPTQELLTLFKGAPVTSMEFDQTNTVLEVVMKAKCFDLEKYAIKSIKEGGICINHRVVTEPNYVFIPGEHILPNGISVIRRGKKSYFIIEWIGMGN